MLGTLESVRLLIENDPVVSDLVSKYVIDADDPENTTPAVAFMTVPDDMDLPYVVTRVDTNILESNDFLKRMVYTVDVFSDNGDIVTADRIARRIEKLLDKERLPLDLGIGIWLETPMQFIPQSDPGIVHIFQQFVIRHL